MTNFDRFEDLVKKIEQDGYLKEYYSYRGDYDARAIAENMVLYTPKELSQNLDEYIDGNTFIDEDGLWNFGPFSDICVDGVCLNDILNYYRDQVLFRQKYSKSWLRHFKRFKKRPAYIPIKTRVIHPVEALRILKDWQEHGCPSEVSCGYDLTHHWKDNFQIPGCGYSQSRSEERYLRKMSNRIKEHPTIYGKFEL